MMTIDDEGEGGVLGNDDVITGTTIFLVNFWDFSKNFSKIFLKFINLDKNFQLFKEIFT